MKTYDLFGLPRPKKVKWVIDIFDKEFSSSVRSASSAWSVRSASSARSARSASSASSAWSASSASSASSAWSASSASSASSAWSASSASSAWSVSSAWSARSWTAIDSDFDWFVVVYEYNKANKDGNTNDKKYLKYSELLLKAKELGVGFWVEWEDVLYLSPVQITLMDDKNRFHNESGSAIYWKGGKEFFYLSGVNFDKTLYNRVTKKGVTAKTILSIENMEQRMVVLKLHGVEKILKGAKLLDKSERGNELYLVKDVFSQDALFLKYTCPSTGRVYVSGVDPSLLHDADGAMAWKFNLTKDDYQKLEIES